MVLLKKGEKDYQTGNGKQVGLSGDCECKNDILTIEFLKVNGFNVKLKSLMEMLYKC